MRSLRTFLLVIGLVLVSNTISIHAADPNMKDIKKVESELADAQARLENVKARLEDQDSNQASGSIKDRIHDVVDSVKSKIHAGSDSNLADMIPDMPDINSIGKESLADKAGRKVREALGRDTLIDKAQSIFNDAKAQLSNGLPDVDLSSIGQESVSERTARRVREVFGRDTVRDKLQRKYNDAFDALNEARDIDLSEYPEKAQALKERLTHLSQVAIDKINDLSVDTDASTWEKLKLKLGITHEPTASEKAQLIAKHLKDQAVESGVEMFEASSNTKVGQAFNAFLGKLGQKPSDAINIAKQWIVSDPETREAARQSKTISKEAHDALDELLAKLLAEAGENAENVESIEVSVKPKSNIKEPTSWLEMAKNKIYGNINDKAESKQFDPATGYEGMKDVLSELVETVKHKSGLSSPLLKDETYAQKAGRKVRETLGRDTASDKLYQAQEGLSKHSILDIIKSKLPAAVQTKLTEADLKSTLGSLGEETLTEKAARKIRESVGKDTLADQLHHALDDIRTNGIIDTASNIASDLASSVKDTVKDKVAGAKDSASNINTDSISGKISDVKDYLSGLTGETRSEKLARKVREALGRDTVLDKAHAKVDEAAAYYNGLKSSASVLSTASDLKDSVLGTKDSITDKVSGIAASINDKLNPQEEKKGKLATVRDALFGDPKDNKIKDAEALLKDAIEKLEQAKKQ